MKQYTQIGNAVPVRLAEVLGDAIRKTLEHRKDGKSHNLLWLFLLCYGIIELCNFWMIGEKKMNEQTKQRVREHLSKSHGTSCEKRTIDEPFLEVTLKEIIHLDII